MPNALRRAVAGLVLWSLMVGLAAAQVTVPSGSTLTIPPGGTLDLGCTPLNVQGNLLVGAGQVTQAAGIGIAASGVLNGGSGTVNVSGDWNNAGTFIAGTGTVVMSTGCAATSIQLLGDTVFNNLVITSASGGTFIIPAGHNITVNGTLTLLGTGGSPLSLISSSGQTAYIALGPGAHVVTTNATVSPGVQIGAAAVAAQGIPTLDEYGVIILSLLLAGIAARTAGRRSQVTYRMVRTDSQGDSRDAS